MAICRFCERPRNRKYCREYGLRNPEKRVANLRPLIAYLERYQPKTKEGAECVEGRLVYLRKSLSAWQARVREKEKEMLG